MNFTQSCVFCFQAIQHLRQHDEPDGTVRQQPGDCGGGEDGGTTRGEKENGDVAAPHAAAVSIRPRMLVDEENNRHLFQ